MIKNRTLCKEEGIREAEGMRQRLSQGERLPAPPQRFIWIAQRPQGDRRKGAAYHARVLTIVKGQRSMLLGVVEGHPLLLVRPGTGKVSEKVQRTPERSVCLEHAAHIVLLLGLAQELCPKVARGLP